MKRLFFSITFILALSASAGAANTECSAIVCGQQNEYRKIDITAVPADVLKEISSRYNGYSALEAYKSEENEYKLVLAKEGKSMVAYYKSTGEFIKEEVK